MTLNIMMGRSRGVRRWMLSAMMALWVVLVAVGAARAELSDREQFVNLIYEGRLQEACDFLSNRPAEVVGEDVKGLEPLLERYAELEATRRERKGASYGEAVEEARKELAAGEVEKALSGVRKAKFYAEDEQQFGQQEWVKQVVAEALLKAEQYLADHEWLKAGNIYGELSTIYEDEKQYEDKTKECATRARIESLYESGEDWQEQVKGIKMDVLAEISYHVENYYVDDPDLRKLTLGGLESLALFTQIEKLKENFPVLADSEKVGAYNERVAGLIEQVKAEKQESFSETDLMRAFVKFMMINQETLELPENLVTREFVDGAMFKLDQFSGVIWPYEMDDFQKHTLGKFSGVGIQITMDKNKLKVITPIFGTPAYKAGIEPGAFITSIDGESTDGITIDQAVRKITGPKGTIVRLGILHSWADDPVDIPIMRDTIIIHTVKGAKLETDDAWDYLIDPEDKIAYLRITSFTESTVEDLHEAIRQIESSGARGLIVDLRFNPGGTLRAAVIQKGTLTELRQIAVAFDDVNLAGSLTFDSEKGLQAAEFSSFALSEGDQAQLSLTPINGGYQVRLRGRQGVRVGVSVDLGAEDDRRVVDQPGVADLRRLERIHVGRLGRGRSGDDLIGLHVRICADPFLERIPRTGDSRRRRIPAVFDILRLNHVAVIIDKPYGMHQRRAGSQSLLVDQPVACLVGEHHLDLHVGIDNKHGHVGRFSRRFAVGGLQGEQIVLAHDQRAGCIRPPRFRVADLQRIVQLHGEQTQIDPEIRAAPSGLAGGNADQVSRPSDPTEVIGNLLGCIDRTP